MSSSKLHTPEDLRAALAALENALGNHGKYALVGGSACAVLGSRRATQDIDFVVLRGQTSVARQLLRGSPNFEVQGRTNYTWYKAAEPVEIEILAPPALFQETFDETTEVITIGKLKVLKPALLLNAKCGSLNNRATEAKKGTDVQDITFLLGYCARNPAYLPKASEVAKATKEFVEAFIRTYGSQDLWIKAGYNLQIGRFTRN
ncbi:hypothetical protein PEX1_033080 [Penicillium expansum]|nr:hypothetical protein PEX1_033080 [Penicillium expansum]